MVGIRGLLQGHSYSGRDGNRWIATGIPDGNHSLGGFPRLGTCESHDRLNRKTGDPTKIEGGGEGRREDRGESKEGEKNRNASNVYIVYRVLLQ